MIRPAQLYEERLQKANIELWYDLKNKYWHGWNSDYKIFLEPDNSKFHQFVSVDKDDNIIGYINYAVDWVNMCVSGFSIISFDKGNLLFIIDLYNTIVYNCFFKYNFNRIEFYCYADNPAIKGYRKFIKRFGGKECGYLRQVCKLMDGTIHDSVIFEILKEDLKVNKEDWAI